MQTKYDHLLVEKDKNQKWIDHKYFSTHDVSKKPFSIVLPPPNVTGKLHLGHAWDGFLQDTMIRYKKLQGYDVCFVPGMDHAGIATQAKVEAKLLESGITKYDLGRKQFIKQVWKWKDEYAKQIHHQWAKLGLALDYDKARFTLDTDANQFVNDIFIKMYQKGLIYRGVKAINWDPKLKTALADIEVINKVSQSKIYYVKYPLLNSEQFIIVATTRLETIFSDVAIAINPNDLDKIKLLNQVAINPLTKRQLPIITDDNIDPYYGSGIMKVSAHSAIDLEIILKNDLEVIECIDETGKMNANGLFTKTMDRFAAREAVYQHLAQLGLIDRVEEIVNQIGYSERSNEAIEVLVRPQWFVKMNRLAKQVLDHLDSAQKVKIYPSRFEGILRKWMENAHDWTISRQLWWGHQIPAWYKNDEIKVQVDSPGKGWIQDEDVLDTWFSSALWPFLVWKQQADLKRYFPTSLLVTGYDIIFFWVARMYFQSLEFMDDLPFKDLLIHGLIRDEQGQKMSKSLGNGIDPMEVIEQYGADALRWFLLTNSSPGQDLNYSEAKIKAGWNLNNKLWNIARFIKTSEDEQNQSLTIYPSDIWIVERLLALKTKVDQKINQYEFSVLGKEIYQFINEDFSAWYIEFAKVWKNKSIALLVLKNLLILIHPFLPFISDHLFKSVFNQELLEQQFDLKPLGKQNQIETIIDVVSLIRHARAEFNISHNDEIEYWIQDNDDQNVIAIINQLANARWNSNHEGIDFALNRSVIKINLNPKLKKQINEHIEKTITKLKAEIDRSQTILNNTNFINKAPQAKVQIEQEKYQNYQKQLDLILKKKQQLKLKAKNF